ncbi:hypothetical protein A2V56_03155 [Candidatus Woesebacteria bacterium RBG_19FT_COMBO_42_9]|uniref:Uncharacterized protein n=1 Tax=Candidatus Woesebacteria bacterium RBG_16_42_24 TaxID=1802485 RepID=A0A1F7XJY8_9BACT|nr:MAG: hypothetical protein A2V97_01950 [Candidatus Woesebacteria bacterium RBG_16_42_24]OGM16375.1 MAG: hypothetical protein A2V56_03155 [Candidatus Woesebacteria bacterium RBG_19FT_COMBO_42_9]OGM67424.1 MAG: hypothetical protein A2985_04775 [Candidatus Woesebacteria bacterium RIFCSPLOWO2_01_FULL_43_11]
MKYLVPILIAIIIILVAALSFGIGKFGFSLKKPETTSPQTSLNSPTLTPTTPAKNTKKVTGGGILSFPKYELSVPDDWQDTRESSGADDEKIILTKGAYQISITQGGFGGAVCLYPGDADTEGPSARYDAFKEITIQSSDLFRRSWTGEELSSSGFGICHKTQYGWGAPTLYGHIAYITPAGKTKTMLDEMDSILSSLKKI